MDWNYFLEQCTDKYGFSDGDQIPVGAYKVRDWLASYLNQHLPDDCPVKAIAFDRPGMHNSCMILFVKKDATVDENGVPCPGADWERIPEEAWDLIECEKMEDAGYWLENSLMIFGRGPDHPIKTLIPIHLNLSEMEGPFECPECGGHMILDFIDDNDTIVYCPYCREPMTLPKEET
jgi:hypothetical protein